jgi:YD repeat-containing protein
LATVKDAAGNVLISYLYDDSGRVSVATSQYGLDEAFTYDVRGRMTQVASSHTAVTAGDLVDDRFAWSKAGLMTGLYRYGLKVDGTARTTPDVYAMTNDTRGRLTNVSLNGGFFGTYSYASNDQIYKFKEQGPDGSTPVVYQQDKLMSRVDGGVTKSWTYDAAGNAIQDLRTIIGIAGPITTTRNHSWDALGQYAGFVQVGSAQTTYYYTPSGQLARVESPGAQANTANYLHVGDLARKDTVSGGWIDRINGVGGVAFADQHGASHHRAKRSSGDR